MGWIIVRRIIKQNTYSVHATYDDLSNSAASTVLSQAASYILATEPMFGDHRFIIQHEGSRRIPVVCLLGVGSNDPIDDLYLIPTDVEPYNDEAMHVERWHFTAAELMVPHSCRLDDQFMAIVGKPDSDHEVEMRRNGIATGHFIGMSNFAKGSAEHLRHIAEQQCNIWKKSPYGNVSTTAHDVVVDAAGKFLCFVKSPEGAKASNEMEEVEARLCSHVKILARMGYSDDQIIAQVQSGLDCLAEQVEKGLCHIGDIDPDTGSSRKRV